MATASTADTNLATLAVGDLSEQAVVTITPGQIHDQIATLLKKHGNDVLKDTACDLAWAQMTQPEQTTAADMQWGTGYTRSEGLQHTTAEAAKSAIASKIKSLYLKSFTHPEAVEWYQYASGLYEKAQGLAVNGSALIQGPNGSVTQALVYYARICMAPPTK